MLISEGSARHESKKMIPYKTILETIAKIEQSFDVNSVSYKDLVMWPLIRLRVYQQLSRPELNFTRREYRDDGEMPIFRTKNNQLKLLRKYKGVDILFFSRVEKYTEKINEKFYNPYIDPMIDLVKDSYSFLKIELSRVQGTRFTKMSSTGFYVDSIIDHIRDAIYLLGMSNNIRKLPRFNPTTFIKAKPRRYKTDTIKSIKNFSDLQQVIKNISGVQIEETRFLEEARLVKAWQAYFTEILAEIRPRAVFLECYYYTIAMALIGACKKLEITTVDIQHGFYGNYHGLYTHWTKIPMNGYDLLPDNFWCWGQISKEHMEKWYDPKRVHHRPIVGGNVRITQWFEKEHLSTDKGIKSFYEELEQKEKNILVTLSDEFVPEHVFDAMRHSPDNWLWLIRLRPVAYTNAKKNQVRAVLKQHGVYNFEIDHATSCRLYDLLKRSDHHVTLYSSVYYEALAFNVPTTIIHPLGLLCYEDEFKKGVLDYADTGELLLASIRKGFKNRNYIRPSDYVETSRQCAENALKVILNKKRLE